MTKLVYFYNITNTRPMKSYLLLLTCFLSFGTICNSQVNVTDIQYDTHNNRIIPKKVAGVELILLFTPDDSLKVYELKNEELILKDSKFYPRLFGSSLWSLFSENFLLTDNEYGSVAYDLRTFSEFIIPYEDNHDHTQWYQANNDLAYVMQKNSDSTIGKFVDLTTQSITPLQEEELVFDQSDNFIHVRNSSVENENKHIVINLTTQDSFIVKTDVSIYFNTTLNDDYFVYHNEGKIYKVDLSVFSSLEIMSIPTDHTFRNIFLVDNYIVTLSYDSNFQHQITVFNEDNEAIVNINFENYMNIVYDHVIDDHIVFSGQYSNFSTLNLNDGTIIIDTFKYTNDLHDLNEEYLIQYDEEYLYFISKIDLQIEKRLIGALVNNFEGITSMEHSDNHIISLDTRFEGDKQLFSVTGSDIERTDFFDDLNSGIPRYSRIHDSQVNEQLILSEDNLYEFDSEGYSKLNEYKIPELVYPTSKILLDNKVCWPEVNNDSKYLIKCFHNDQIVDYGEIPNAVHSDTEVGMTEFTESNGDILYLKYNSSFYDEHELRIKKRDSNVDSLIKLMRYEHDFFVYNGIPFYIDSESEFYGIPSTLFSFDFSTYTLHDLGIPTKFSTNKYDFTEYNGDIFYHDYQSVYKVNGIESELIHQSNSQFIDDIRAVGKYLRISAHNSDFYYYENNVIEIPHNGEFVIHYLGGKFVGFSPGYNENITEIQNIETKEKYQLPDEFSDKNITDIITTKEHPITVSIKQIEGIYHIVFDSFNDDYSAFSQLYSYPISNPYPLGTSILYQENYTMAFIDNQVSFINNETGALDDNITVLGVGFTSQCTYKDGLLYFIRYGSQLGRQVFMYEPVISGTKEVNQPTFALFPNPTSNTMKVESDKPFQAWNLLSIDGQQLLGNYNNSSETTIDAASLDSGIYIIEIFSNGNKQSKKFIKL